MGSGGTWSAESDRGEGERSSSVPGDSPDRETPPLPPGHRVRDRCEGLLEEAAAAPLVLVVAGAGWGKTALLSSWATTTGASWLTLDTELGQRQTFWRAAASMLEHAGVSGLPAAATSPESKTFQLELAEAVATHDSPVHLVLDEFEHVHDDAVVDDLEQLLHHARDRLRLVIASRLDPPFRLQRLRLSGLLAELRAPQLAFTLGESGPLFAAHGVELPKAEVELIWRRTEGWPAGLGLAALALRRGTGPATAERALAEAERDLNEYLLGEVVHRQAPERLDLLLRTSILTRVDDELAAAVVDSGDPPRLLAELAREGFLTESGSTGSYRCHSLLRAVLQSEAAGRLQAELPELHRRAGHILEGRGEALEAIRHAVAGKHWEQAAALLGEHWLRLVTQVGIAELKPLIDQVPRELVRGDADLALAAAGVQLETGTKRAADELLALAAQLAPTLTDERRTRVLVTTAAIDLSRARAAGDVEHALEAARTNLPNGWEPEVGTDLRAVTLANLGMMEFWAGEFDLAGSHLEQSSALAAAHGNDYLLLIAQSYTVSVDLACGRLDDVRRRAEAVHERACADGWSELPHVAMAYLSLGAAHLWTHEVDTAERWAERARRAVAEPRERLPYVGVAQLRALLLALRGEVPTALEVLRAAHTVAEPLPRPLRLSGALIEADLRLALGEAELARTLLETLEAPEAAIGLARVELAAGDPGAAAATIARFRSDEQSGVRPYVNVEAWLIDAIAHDAMRDGEEALHSLERALDYAEPRGFRHPFMRLGPLVRSLLRRHAQGTTAHPALVDDLLALFDAGERGSKATGEPLLEPLSERELVVLRYLPTMMSNAEIAAEMFVSVNTVKTHLRHVYAKLGVSSRREAVARARKLHLLSYGLQAD